jgi:hypothetical protein
VNAETRKSLLRLSGINILLGLWILISPYVLAFHQLPPAVWNNVILGILIAFFAFVRVSSIENQPVWSWWNALLGLWVVISPFVLGFAQTTTALVNNIVAGALVGLLACTSAHVTAPQKTGS